MNQPNELNQLSGIEITVHLAKRSFLWSYWFVRLNAFRAFVIILITELGFGATSWQFYALYAVFVALLYWRESSGQMQSR